MHTVVYQLPGNGDRRNRSFASEAEADAWVEEQWKTMPGLKIIDEYELLKTEDLGMMLKEREAAWWGMTVEEYDAWMAQNKIRNEERHRQIMEERARKRTAMEYRGE